MDDDKRSVLERLRDDQPDFVADFKAKLKEIENERVRSELELIQARTKLAIANFIESRKLNLKKMKKHRVQRKLRGVIKNVLVERGKEVRSVFDLPRASNKHLSRFGALHGLERGPKETASAFRQRLLNSIKGRGR